MGTVSRSGLGDALFGRVRQRVLGLLFGDPGRSFHANELIRLADAGTGAVQRELERLSAAGLVTVQRAGNRRLYRADPDSPIFAELRGIVLKTVGLADVIADALAPLAPGIQGAFVFGSVARGQDTSGSDIDLIVLSDRYGYGELFTALESASQRLGRAVNPLIYTRDEFDRKLAKGGAWAANVRSGGRIWIIGEEGDLAT